MATGTEKINVLLVGGGGREHALAWRLRESARLGELWVTNPENPGLAALGRAVDVPLDYERPFRLQLFCDKHDIGLVVIGPEAPLAVGLADALAAPAGESAPKGSERVRVVFGPGREAARLEADKAWAKSLMRAAAVPMAEGRSFTDPEAAKDYLRSRETAQVVKASGLAAGKGVFVPDSVDEACEAVDRIMVKREFGDAGSTIVIEERLKGREASILALVDGRTIYTLEPCQDHKRLGDNDTGPNTGGMGVYCPGGITDERMLARVEREIIVPVVDVLRREGLDFRGVLFAGLMLTHAGPKVLEFNVRFGDPECQALMARWGGAAAGGADLLDALYATGSRRLDEVDLRWTPAASCVVVLASRGYPENPEKGKVIEGIEEAEAMEGVKVLHAGTRRDDEGRIVTAGGRVLNVVGTGETIEEARQRAYRACEVIRFEGKTMRTDIGATAPSVASR
jgi:phosphoribosylamine--glycine ligase